MEGDEDLYDEFGNYIGPPEEGSDDVASPAEHSGSNEADSPDSNIEQDNTQQPMEVDESSSNAIILHEDKQYYPTAQQVYGPDVETLVQEEDTQLLSQPIVAPVTEKKVIIEETKLPGTNFKRQFMADLMKSPETVRNVAVVGHLHHGKTTFIDMLVKQTHDLTEWEKTRAGHNATNRLRYTDISHVEQQRGMSFKSAPISLVLQNSKDKSFAINLIDTPGHADFLNEVACSIRLADGILLVVDVIEGLHVTTKKIVEHAILNKIPITLVVNKMDRLILEARLPEDDAYWKILQVIESVNEVIETMLPETGHLHRVSPEKGNVLFSAPEMEWAFTIKSFANLYRYAEPKKDWDEVSRRFWGEIFWNPGKRVFTRDPREKNSKRAFIWWILDPLYKLYSIVLRGKPEQMKQNLAELGIKMKPKEINVDPKKLIVNVCKRWFMEPRCFVDVVTEHIPSPRDGAKRMLDNYYSGKVDESSPAVKSMLACDSNGPLIIHVTKQFHTSDAKSFNAFGRIMSGSIEPNTKVRVLGSGYTVEYEEDVVEAEVDKVWIDCSRYKVPMSYVGAGNLVLLSNLDHAILDTATIIFAKGTDAAKNAGSVHIFKPIRHFYESTLKIQLHPEHPTELPVMVEATRKACKAYPGLRVLTEGQHLQQSLIFTGEVGMDTLIYDIRQTYTNSLGVKVSDLMTPFCETVDLASTSRTMGRSPNGKNTIYVMAEPLDKVITADIEAHRLDINEPIKELSRKFRSKYDWDALASRNVWAFGPSDTGPNLLVNETTSTDIDQASVVALKNAFVQGFKWACREGPLCNDMIRGVKFRLIEVDLAPEAKHRTPSHIIPAMRQACHAAFFVANPRMMEPIARVTIQGIPQAIPPAYDILHKRRGHVLTETLVPGTPFTRLDALIPVMDSVGFDHDVRIAGAGSCLTTSHFEEWQIVTGDPLDRSIELPVLAPAGANALARDFMTKTRRIKDLRGEPSIPK